MVDAGAANNWQVQWLFLVRRMARPSLLILQVAR